MDIEQQKRDTKRYNYYSEIWLPKHLKEYRNFDLALEYDIHEEEHRAPIVKRYED